MASEHDAGRPAWNRALRAVVVACLAATATAVDAVSADQADLVLRRAHWAHLRTARGLSTAAGSLAPGAPANGAADSSLQEAIAEGHSHSARSLVWAHLFGTSDFTVVIAVAVDGRDVYAFGLTTGDLDGGTSAGEGDLFLRRYDRNGQVVWTRQFGTSGFDFGSSSIAVEDGAIYVAGSVLEALPGQTSSGDYDAFLRKYDTNGNELWTRQFGTDTEDDIHAVAVSGGRVFVTGSVGAAALPGQTYAGGPFDGFIRAYDEDGDELWTRQFGTDGFDHALALAAAGEGVYVGGWTDGVFPGQSQAGFFDAFLRKYDRRGRLKWTRQFGTEGFDSIHALAADAEAVYVHGVTEGALPGQTNAGLLDLFLRKYGVGGAEQWTRQYGNPGWDQAGGMALRAGTVLLASEFEHTLEGGGGETNAALTAYDAWGSRRLTLQFGTEGLDGATSVAAGRNGRIVVGGYAGGPLFGQEFSGGFIDGFVVKLGR